MNKTNFKTAVIIGGSAVALGAAALAAKKALKHEPVLSDLTANYKSHNGINEGLNPGKKTADKKTIISQLVENPHLEANFFPVPSKKEGAPEKPTSEFLKMHGINFDG